MSCSTEYPPDARGCTRRMVPLHGKACCATRDAADELWSASGCGRRPTVRLTR